MQAATQEREKKVLPGINRIRFKNVLTLNSLSNVPIVSTPKVIKEFF